MKRDFLLAILFITIPIIVSYAQPPDLKETFVEAESYFLFEEYNEALPLYLKLRRANPSNNNINYKIGICFLNDPFQKDKAIFYLEEAVKDVNPKYKNNNFKERSAPLEAYFYLGNAYLVNDNIDKALENYNYFNSILDEKIYDAELVREQIKICENARELKQLPIDYDNVNLSEAINSRFSDINPILSGDGNRIVFVSKRAFYDATFFSEKVNGEWQPPRNIIPEIGVDGDVYPTSLSWDGNMMIIYRNDEFIGNLYKSEYVDGRWTAMEKLGDNINTKYWESHGSLSKDGKTLYFTSNRKFGFGGLDIYKSNLEEDGTWGVPENLGKEINTRYNEETPFITENGKTLYFSSYGHYNMGGYDVFYSKKDNQGEWSTPINLGYPINTTDDNVFYYPVNNGMNAYYSQFREEGYGRQDIYYLSLYSDNNPRLYLITGSLNSDKGELVEEDEVLLYLVDQETGDTVQYAKPNLVTQSFELKAPKGEYDLILSSVSFNDLLTKIRIDERTEKSGLRLQEELALESKIYEPLLLTEEDSRIISEDSAMIAIPGEGYDINLKLEQGSTLFASHIVDSIVIATDTFNITENDFVYELIPQYGENFLELIMLEKNGDRSLKTIIVNSFDAIALENDSISKTPIYSNQTNDILAAEPDSSAILVQNQLEELTEYSGGNLKITLKGIDIKELEIKNSDDIFQYLEKQGVETEEINELKASEVSKNNPDKLLKNLIQNSDDELSEYLESVNLDTLGIETSGELIQYLKLKVNKNDTEENEITLIIDKIVSSPTEQEKTIIELVRLAEGELKDYLLNMDLYSLDIYNSKELIDHIVNHVGVEFETKTLIPVLANLLKDRSVDTFKEYLISEGPEKLSELLMNIDLEKEKLRKISDLIDFIIGNSEELGLSEEELNLLIINRLAEYSKASEIDSYEIVEKPGASPALKITGGILFIGILIFIIFYFRRKQNKEDQD